jgi:hypothetical protein
MLTKGELPPIPRGLLASRTVRMSCPFLPQSADVAQLPRLCCPALALGPVQPWAWKLLEYAPGVADAGGGAREPHGPAPVCVTGRSFVASSASCAVELVRRPSLRGRKRCGRVLVA